MNPYLIDHPATISFSGGRTSGFMLAKIIEAYGGTLPDDVLVCFQNTGLEHPKTYEFIEEVGKRWCRVIWLEYRRENGSNSFAVVDAASASRNGEPFSVLIGSRQYLPNPVARFCTVELKISTLNRFVKALGWTEWTSAIGLRADEPRRVARMKGDIAAVQVAMPIADAGHTKEDVLAFWKEQPFDLMLPGGDNSFGNCVGCFLKGRGKLIELMRQEPQHFRWWAEAEAESLNSSPAGARFRTDRPSYAQMLEIARSQGVFEFDDDDTVPCACTD